jgi:hypothetical protein
MTYIYTATTLFAIAVAICPSLLASPFLIWRISRAQSEPDELIYGSAALHSLCALGFLGACWVYWSYFLNCTACTNGLIVIIHASIAATVCWLVAAIATVPLLLGLKRKPLQPNQSSKPTPSARLN